MKKVIFLCLFSLSLCVSKPANEGAAPGQPQSLSSPPIEPKANIKLTEFPTNPILVPPSTVNDTVIVPILAQNSTQVKTETATDPKAPATEKSSASSTTTDNKTTEKKEETPKENAVKEPAKVSPQNKAQETPSTSKTEEAPKVPPVTVPSSPASKDDVTTKPNAKPAPSVVPKDDAAAHPIEGRPGFDGASFVGGIILTLGLLAIGFMGFKYYKNHTERNYHTL